MTGEAARSYVHALRKRYTGIMAGIGTVMADDPVVAVAAAPVPVPVAMEGRRKLPILPFSPVSTSASLMCTTCK